MQTRTYLRISFVLTLAGVLFSGYLSGKKWLTGICAFNEPCPYFLGYPACWYGFGLFALMFITTLLGVAGVLTARRARLKLGFLSFVGILFAGRFVILEIAKWTGPSGMPDYSLGLPTCAYGLVFYILIFAVTLAVKSDNQPVVSSQVN